MSKIVNVTMTFVLVVLVGVLLIAGRNFLIPFIIALLIWHLLNSMNIAIVHIPKIGRHIHPFFTMLISLSFVSIALNILIEIIGQNMNQVIAAAPKYQASLLSIFNTLDARFHINGWFNADTLFKSLDMQGVIVNFYGMMSSIASSAILIFMYVVFLFIEQLFFHHKLMALFPQKSHRELVQNILNQIAKETQTYMGIKTFVSFLSALLCYGIMTLVHLDFAAFWALLIFFLNFIPNIGPMLATVFPALLALLQFPDWASCVVVTSGIVSIQFITGSIIEPKMMGKTLNLSPLVILIALSIWGEMWGFVGMFLSVPITVMMMIIFSHFDKTRGIAILLSQDGLVKKTDVTS